MLNVAVNVNYIEHTVAVGVARIGPLPFRRSVDERSDAEADDGTHRLVQAAYALQYGYGRRRADRRGRLVYPLFERSRPRNVCGRLGRATASTENNRYYSFDICMETTTLHAYIDGRPTNRLRLCCGSAHPYRQEIKLRARALHDENGRGGPMLPPGCCSRFVWPTRSTPLLARAPIVVCSRGSQRKYCVAL